MVPSSPPDSQQASRIGSALFTLASQCCHLLTLAAAPLFVAPPVFPRHHTHTGSPLSSLPRSSPFPHLSLLLSFVAGDNLSVEGTEGDPWAWDVAGLPLLLLLAAALMSLSFPSGRGMKG